MIIENASLLVCPFCKGEKPVIRIGSGNTFGATQRSDLKTTYPMMASPSSIQHCPHCGKYFFIHEAHVKKANFTTTDEGDLSYLEIREALQQFAQQKLETRDEIDLRMLFVQAYNSTYQLDGKSIRSQPTEEERLLFQQQVDRLLEIWEVEPLVQAEFLRETGRFEECIDVLDSLQVEEPFKLKIAYQIRQFAVKKSTDVFIIYGMRNDFKIGSDE